MPPISDMMMMMMRRRRSTLRKTKRTSRGSGGHLEETPTMKISWQSDLTDRTRRRPSSASACSDVGASSATASRRSSSRAGKPSLALPDTSPGFSP